MIRRGTTDDAAALAELHLDVWDEAYAGLVPPQVLDARRAAPGARVELWRAILAESAARAAATRAAATRAGAGAGGSVLVAERGDALLGFVTSGPGRDEPQPGLPEIEVMALYVRAEVYGAGVGHRLLVAAVGEAPAYLWVLAGNARAIAFYRRQGFVFDGATKVAEVGVEHRMVRR